MPATSQLLALLPIPVLAFVAMTDVVSRRVPNWVCAFIAGFGLATRITAGDLLPSLLVAALLYALLLFAWTRNALGGGDVKLLPACTLMVPAYAVPALLLAVTAAGGILALLYLPGRFLPPRSRPLLAAQKPAPKSALLRMFRVEAWRSRRHAPLPYACAIAAGCVFTLVTG